MNHNSIHWNISSEKAFDLIHSLLINILKEQKNKLISFNDLVYLLNCRSKFHKIHKNKKHNSLSKYIRINFGSLEQFLDDYHIYGISKNNNIIYVHLIEQELQNFPYGKRFTQDNEWVLL